MGRWGGCAWGVLGLLFSTSALANPEVHSRQILELRRDLLAVELPAVVERTDGEPMADVRPISDYWRETGIRFQHLRTEVTDELCERSEKNFLACLAAMNVLAESTALRGRVVAAPVAVSQASQVQSTVARSGEFQLVQFADEPVLASAAAQWQRRRGQLRFESRAARQSFNTYGASALNFSSFLEALRARAITAEGEAKQSAQAYNALLAEQFDPHTYLIPTQYESDRSNSPESSFVGIGISLAADARGAVVTHLVEGGPAHRGGVYTGDALLEIDGRPLAGMRLSAILALIRGEAGTRLAMTFGRGTATRTFQITRQRIVEQNVSGRLLSEARVTVGYIQLRRFSENSACDQVADQVRDLERRGARALLLDLRGNGGGYAAQAVCIAGLFLERGTSVYIERRLSDGRSTTHLTERAPLTELPLMILLDGSSASASELLAGALQDHQRAWVAGQRSFGKATVQYPIRFSISGVTLRQTIARFFRPHGGTNQLVGIIPDFVIDPVANANDDDRLVMREEDLYTNALSAIGPAWRQPRPALIRQILAHCAGYEARVAARQSTVARGPLRLDYLRAVAAELLGCALPGRGRGLARE